jgi:hypothetical protein
MTSRFFVSSPRAAQNPELVVWVFQAAVTMLAAYAFRHTVRLVRCSGSPPQERAVSVTY